MIVCEVCKKKCKKQAIKLSGNIFYHVECFKCGVCRCDLPLKCFYKKGQELFCQQDFFSLYGSWCGLCCNLISEYAAVVKEKTYHPECLKCSECGRRIIAGEAANSVSNCIICNECFASKRLPVIGKGRECKGETNISTQEPFNCHDVEDSQNKLANDGKVTVMPLNDGRNSAVYLSARSSSPFVYAANGISQKSRSVTGMTFDKFCNFSYLERMSCHSFRRGPITSSSSKAITHFHRPDSRFSYNYIREDILSEIKKAKGLGTLSHTSFEGSATRDGWPGPPEPAAAYPESFRETLEVFRGKVDERKVKECERLSKEISVLEKMVHSSGMARAIWNDLKRERVLGDPRTASRDPAADSGSPICMRSEIHSRQSSGVPPSRDRAYPLSATALRLETLPKFRMPSFTP